MANIDSIASETDYNGKKLIDGSLRRHIDGEDEPTSKTETVRSSARELTETGTTHRTTITDLGIVTTTGAITQTDCTLGTESARVNGASSTNTYTADPYAGVAKANYTTYTDASGNECAEFDIVGGTSAAYNPPNGQTSVPATATQITATLTPTVTVTNTTATTPTESNKTSYTTTSRDENTVTETTTTEYLLNEGETQTQTWNKGRR